MSIPYTITDLTCTVYLDGKPFTVDRTTQTFKRLVEAFNALADADDIRRILSSYQGELDARLEKNKGRVVLTRTSVTYDGQPVVPSLARRIMDIAAAGLPVDPWIALVENLYLNEADYVTEEFYDWMEHSDLPITDDGCFLAYKKVRADFMDCHTGTFDNSPGKTVVMPGGRPAVDPIRTNLCSTGLHFCSKSYLSGFSGDKVVLLKINPADVVSIPDEYGHAKGRTWKYEVLREVEDYTTQTWAPVVANDGTEWFNFDPRGNEIVEDEDEWEQWYSEADDEEVLLEDDIGEYTLGVYPEDVEAHLVKSNRLRTGGLSILYPKQVGDAVRLYTDGGSWDFDEE